VMYDFVVVGCGIIGLTIAIEIKKTFGGNVCIIEKEKDVGAHASGRNSGVLHAGIYYKPGTLKGRLIVEGNKAMREYCEEKGIRQVKGKVIVTKSVAELESLKELETRAKANGADVRVIGESELKEIEPHARTVGSALYSPNTITTNPKEVLHSLLDDAMALGIETKFGVRMTGVSGKKEIETTGGKMGYGFLVNAAGAYADNIAHMFGVGTNYVMIPYKGIYYRLKDNRAHMVNSNIYPVPDMRFPFLGVHFTKTPDGVVKIGPTAIAALSKENYGFFDNIRAGELNECLRCNARKLFTDKNYLLLGIKEISKYIPYMFYVDAKRLVPGLKFSHIQSYPNAGIRAQLFDKNKKELEMDFIVEKQDNTLHVLNAVSPAYTSSITFAKHVVGFIK